MTARHALALVGCALVALAGCAGAPAGPTNPDGPASPTPTATPVPYESDVFDHAGVDSPAIEGGITYPTGGAYVARSYVTVVETQSAADRFNHSVLDGEASAFVNETSFADSALVVIQAFPASSHPSYRVESVRRTDGGLAVRINDSSEGATADITVETVLLRVRGDAPETVTVTTEENHTFDTAAGVVTGTPVPTPTTEPETELPDASEDPGENVDEPRRLRVRNRGEETNDYRVNVDYRDGPDCRDETPTLWSPNWPSDGGRTRAGPAPTCPRRTGPA